MNGRMFVNSLLIYYLVQCGFNSLTNMADVKPVLWTILDSGLMERRIGLDYWTRVNSFFCRSYQRHHVYLFQTLPSLKNLSTFLGLLITENIW